MRKLFIISFIANLVLTVVVMFMAPTNMAVHFGAGGEPNGWSTPGMNALVMTGVEVMLFAIFFFVSRLLRITPDRWISLPNKDYWLKDENRGRMEAILSDELHKYGALMFVFMFVVGLLTLQANLSDPVQLREDLFWPPFICIMAYSLYWTVRMFWIFRVPKGEQV